MIVSVIVPVYNVSGYLRKCIDSICNSVYRELEIILVDDGSPDNCPQMCDCYAQKDHRIKVVHKSNEGLGFARNSGLEQVAGEYVAFVDSDDYVSSNMYEILYMTAVEHNCDVVYSGFKKGIASGCFIDVQEVDGCKEFRGKQIDELIPDFIAAPPYSKKEYIYEMSVWHSIYRADIIKKNSIRFVSEREFASEDIPFQIDFLKCASNAAFIPDVLYVYCYNSGSLTKKFPIEKFDRMKKLYELLVIKTKEYDNDALRPTRLFIGYVRTFIRQIVSSELRFSTKMSYIKVVAEDPVWNSVRKRYRTKYLPAHQNIMLKLIFLKCKYMVYLYSWIFNMVR